MILVMMRRAFLISLLLCVEVTSLLQPGRSSSSSRSSTLFVATTSNAVASAPATTENSAETLKVPPASLDYSHVMNERDPTQWTSSVTPRRDIVYAPALEAQMKMIESLGLKQVGLDEKFELQFSKMKQARIANMQFEGGMFRKVRMTYFDAGPNVQVFNALWMPRYEYDVPMLGVDLISLGKTRVLSVVDMQPLHPDGEYSQRYIERDEITGIRDRYPDLQGKLSGKIYDDTSFFSKNMLFGRFSDESQLKPVVHAAHDEYLTAYHNMVASATPNADPAAMAVVKERQTAYDIYSAEKDPAVGLFDAYFGKEWSEEFVHSFLFGLSKEGNSSGSEGVTKPKPERKPPVHQFKFTPEGEQTPQVVGGGGGGGGSG